MPRYKRINKDFFKKPSREMAYVLGFFAADGNIIKTKRGGHFISFQSADRDILVMIRKTMGSDHKLAKRVSKAGCWYRIQIGSRGMFHDLLLLGMTPNKAKRIRFPKIMEKFLGDFIRGYFDGDGNVWVGYINQKRKTPTRVIQATFTSGSRSFLQSLLTPLWGRDFRGGSLYQVKNKKCWRLMFSTKDALKLYKIMYNVPHGLHLKRKKTVFEKFIKMRE